MIQTTLLSALNGICHELGNVGRTPHRITEYTIVGMEATKQTLILQNFVLYLPKSWSVTPTYVVRERCFFEKTPTSSAPTGELPVDLLHCNFSPKHSGSRKHSFTVVIHGGIDGHKMDKLVDHIQRHCFQQYQPSQATHFFQAGHKSFSQGQYPV